MGRTRNPRASIPKYSEEAVRETTTKRRAIITPIPNAWLRTVITPPPGVTGQVQDTETEADHSNLRVLNGTQITVSENHPLWGMPGPQGQVPPSWDDGGNFFTQRRECTYIGAVASLGAQAVTNQAGTTKKTQYKGPFIPHAACFDGARWPAPNNSSSLALDAAGTTAIARCKPAQPVASLATALIELRREGLPKMVGHQTWKGKTTEARRRALGGEYLNIEFGWKPLVNDIVDTAVVISESDALINQYVRDAGKQIRRRYEFPPIRVESTEVFAEPHTPVTWSLSSSGLNDFGQLNKGRVLLHKSMEKRCWFSGSFIYHLPIDPSTMKAMKERSGHLKKLLGLDLTPDTIWNATPWSWAVDWITNTGDVISNLQSWTTDGMVMRYGYIMEHVKCVHTYSFSGPTGHLPPMARPSVLSFSVETKTRRKATPFGFGLKYGQFTDRQWAIVAALGIARS